ncbi:hypothetical protein ACNKHO_15130 [Shigella flexneri]
MGELVNSTWVKPWVGHCDGGGGVNLWLFVAPLQDNKKGASRLLCGIHY